MFFQLSDGLKLKAFQRLVCYLSRTGTSLIISSSSDSFSLRALNEGESALPHIQIKSSFFENYKYTHKKPRITIEISASPIKYALKTAFFNGELNFTINKVTKYVDIKWNDEYDITHIWNVPYNKSKTMNAVYDENLIRASLTCRWDIFAGLEQAFKGNQLIILRFNSKKDRFPIELRTRDCVNEKIISTFVRFEKNDKCDPQFSEDLEVTFSLNDFTNGIYLSSIMSQRVNIYCIGPGNPLIMRASMPNMITFEMVLATSNDDDSEKETEDFDGQKEPVIYVPGSSAKRINVPNPNEFRI